MLFTVVYTTTSTCTVRFNGRSDSEKKSIRETLIIFSLTFYEGIFSLYSFFKKSAIWRVFVPNPSLYSDKAIELLQTPSFWGDEETVSHKNPTY